MKKIFRVVLILAVCFGLGISAYFVRAEIKSRETFEYDIPDVGKIVLKAKFNQDLVGSSHVCEYKYYFQKKGLEAREEIGAQDFEASAYACFVEEPQRLKISVDKDDKERISLRMKSLVYRRVKRNKDVYWTTIVMDRDKDGYADEYDNCPGASNRDQIDSDQDGKGDVCDSERASMISMPNITGLTRAEAEATLKAKGIQYGTVYEYSGIIPAEMVIRQSPEADAVVNPKTVGVGVFVSAGPEQ